jgi:restriction endonuclease S subunit
VARLGEVCTLTKGAHSSTKTEPGPYPLIVTAEEPLTSADYQFEGDAVCVPLISSTGHGKASIKRIHFASGRFAVANLLAALQPIDDDALSAKFLFFILRHAKDRMAGLMKGAANVSMKIEDLAEFPIPLPPLDVQREIVAEIEGCQKVIDGARAVVDNYRPHIPIDPEWPVVELGDIAEIIMGQSPPGETYNREGRGVPLINGPVEFGPEAFSRTVVNQYTTAPSKMCREGDLILCVRGSTTGRMNIAGYAGCLGRGVAAIRCSESQAWINFVVNGLRDRIYALGVGSTFPNITGRDLAELPIPMPPLETQRAIVAEIEAEQALVAANRELIARFERKIAATLARVWGAADSNAVEG